jgi:SAM-dependent methyltransferase
MKGNETFEYRGEELHYFNHMYNCTRLNERAVELAIARHFMSWAQHDAWTRKRSAATGLELGNVTSHYWPAHHRIVDRYEEAAGVENIDVFDLASGSSADWIIAISTLEHVRWDEPDRDPNGAANAIWHLKSLLKPGGRMLVTCPLGYHPQLDREILSGRFEDARQTCFVRTGDIDWVESDEIVAKPYGATSHWAESLWVAEFYEEWWS